MNCNLCVIGVVQFVMFQLVLASILQILRDPFSKVLSSSLFAFRIHFCPLATLALAYDRLHWVITG